MNAAEVVRAATAAGLTLVARGEKLSVKPAGRLSADLRLLLVNHKTELLDYLREASNDGPHPRNCAWTILLTDGARLTAVNATGADAVEMLELARDQFGCGRVADVRAAG